jgi:hypothetical protein
MRDQGELAAHPRYRASGIGELVRFDPLDEVQPIRVWDGFDGDLVERARRL